MSREEYLEHSWVDIPGVSCSPGRPILHRGLEALPWIEDFQPQRVTDHLIGDGASDELCDGGVDLTSTWARQKLYLASRRETTREEDMAYSLFGIFNVALPVIYGEGIQAVDRLLEHILTRSANVTLLAWTGSSGSHHSYLPSDLTVYDQILPPHVPALIETAEMDYLVRSLRSSLPDPSPTVAIYEQFYNLPLLSLIAGRLRLPGIVFPLADVVLVSESDLDSDLLVYRGTSPMIGDVEVTTREDLSGLKGGLLIHPWISPLLDQDFSRGEPLSNLTTRALQLAVRLKQPFGALLLAPLARAQYRRVATNSLIMVHIREETSLADLMDGIRTVDIQ